MRPLLAGDDQSILDKPHRIQRTIDAADRVQKAVPHMQMRDLSSNPSSSAEDAEAIQQYARLAHTDKYVSRQLQVLEEAEACGQARLLGV